MGSLATIIVSYGEGADTEGVIVELDDSINLDSTGKVKSSFTPSDNPVFLIHYKPTIFIDKVVATAGTVKVWNGSAFDTSISSDAQAVTLQREQEILFVRNNKKEALTYLPSGSITKEWSDPGRTPSSFLSTEDNYTTSLEIEGAPVFGNISYPVKFDRWRLFPPALTLADDETFNIHVVVYAEKLI